MTDLDHADAIRFAELGRRMNEMLCNMTPPEKDRLLQRHLAAVQTPTQKFKALGVMMNFVIAQLQLQTSGPSNG